MKNFIVLLFVGLLGTSCLGAVAAQELLVAPHEMEVGGAVPDLALPPGEMESSGDEPTEMMDDGTWDSSAIIEGELEPSPLSDYGMMACDALSFESTGTWIRRGFWYAEVDAVILNRVWGREPVTLIEQQVGVGIIQTQIGPQQIIISNQLNLEGDKPGAEAAPRLTVGRFLFRDSKNRDHVGEFTIFGGGQWTQQGVLNANPNNSLNTGQNPSLTLQVPSSFDSGNDSFDGATSSQFRYDSRFNSFELNYHLKGRMGRDHMELEPTGEWVRRAGPSVSRSLIAGLRFFDLNEDFDWSASGIGSDPNTGDAGQSGLVRNEADNDLLGTQLGFTWTFERARWSAGLRGKGGMFVNLIDSQTFSQVPTADPNAPLITEKELTTEEVSFLGELAGVAKWHIQPNFSLRASVEAMYVTSAALAPLQSSFVPGGPTTLFGSNHSWYLGGAIGFEGYW